MNNLNEKHTHTKTMLFELMILLYRDKNMIRSKYSKKKKEIRKKGGKTKLIEQTKNHKQTKRNK